VAKYNLTDSTLPPYYTVLNSILLVSASSDWEEVEPYRVAAENTWLSVYLAAHSKTDYEAVKILQDLRDYLDLLAKDKEEYDLDVMDAKLGAEHEMEEDVHAPVTARGIVKSEAWAESMAEHETEDTAGLKKDPFNDALADTV
jgi:hypothetical protein